MFLRDTGVFLADGRLDPAGMRQAGGKQGVERFQANAVGNHGESSKIG
jgi:hypothetical protein